MTSTGRFQEICKSGTLLGARRGVGVGNRVAAVCERGGDRDKRYSELERYFLAGFSEVSIFSSVFTTLPSPEKNIFKTLIDIVNNFSLF